MADTNDRHQGSENDLFDETAPRSIFAATWFRAVLVLIVLGVIGAVAVPYILDAMNAPKSGTTAKLPTPVPLPSKPAAPPAPVAATPPPLPSVAPPGAGAATPPTPPSVATPEPVPAPPTSVAVTPPATPPTLTEKPSDTKDAMVAATTPADTPKAEPKTKPAATKAAVRTAKPAAGRQWFVQVGAFKDAGTAKKVAAKLREDQYTVEESPRSGSVATVAKATTSAETPSSAGSDHYDVIITGQLPAEINSRLSAKGLAAEPAANGAVVKPSLPLRDAVALSKDLAVDGLKVQVRRAGGSATSTPKASSGATTSGDSLHRVSVGGFADRATAMAALKELEAKGYKPFLTRR
jgi:cell division septation protein DedD